MTEEKVREDLKSVFDTIHEIYDKIGYMIPTVFVDGNSPEKPTLLMVPLPPEEDRKSEDITITRIANLANAVRSPRIVYVRETFYKDMYVGSIEEARAVAASVKWEDLEWKAVVFVTCSFPGGLCYDYYAEIEGEEEQKQIVGEFNYLGKELRFNKEATRMEAN